MITAALAPPVPADLISDRGKPGEGPGENDDFVVVLSRTTKSCAQSGGMKSDLFDVDL